MNNIIKSDEELQLEEHFEKTIKSVESVSVDNAKKLFGGIDVSMGINPHLSDELYDILVNSEIVYCDSASHNLLIYDTAIIADTLVHSFSGNGIDFDVAKIVAKEVLILQKAYSFILIDC